MTGKEALLNTLEHFMIHIQITNDYYMETKLKACQKAIEEVKSNMVTNMDWLYSNSTILLESIPVYRAFLKRRITEATPGDEDIESCREENRYLARIESKLNEFRESVMNSNHI